MNLNFPEEYCSVWNRNFAQDVQNGSLHSVQARQALLLQRHLWSCVISAETLQSDEAVGRLTDFLWYQVYRNPESLFLTQFFLSSVGWRSSSQMKFSARGHNTNCDYQITFLVAFEMLPSYLVDGSGRQWFVICYQKNLRTHLDQKVGSLLIRTPRAFSRFSYTILFSILIYPFFQNEIKRIARGDICSNGRETRSRNQKSVSRASCRNVPLSQFAPSCANLPKFVP